MRKMNLILIAALIAASSAAKLDRSYLPPASAKTAGGNPDSLQTPFTRSSQNQGLGGLPSGSYENEFQGVVVDAANPGTRTAGTESGLGGPRISYGSADSKVGEAAFRGSLTGFRQTGQGFNNNGQFGAQGSFGSTENKSERPQAAKDRAANTVKQDSDVGSETYSYGYETDNGIAAVENGIAINGVQAQGGFSYKGDDGQTYSITYTADEGGYRPQGSHLPTPPPIPEEILKSLEQNAKDEAAGLVDDGSYDAQKYNEGDYSGGDNTNSGNSQSQFGKRPGVSFNQNLAFEKPTSNSGYSGTNGYRPNGNNIGQSATSISGTGSQSGGDNNNAGNGQSLFGTRPGGASFNQNQGFGKPSSNSGYSGFNGQVNGNNNGQAASSLFGTGLQSVNDNTNAGNVQTQFGTQPGTSFNQNQAFGKPSSSSGYTGINGYRPNVNNNGQTESNLSGSGYQTNQFQSGLNTFNQRAAAQELNPQGQNVDSSPGQVGPNQASAQALSYGNGQASAQASTGPQFGQTNKFANQGTFGSQSQQSARPQFGAQPSRPQFGQPQSPSNNQASQISSSSQVDSQSLQPDAEESSSNVDSSLNQGQGQNIQTSDNIQTLGGQRPQQGFGSHSSFNRPSSSQTGQTSYNSGNSFVSAPNNAFAAGQTNANAFASNNEYLPPGNFGFGSKPIQGLPQKPVPSPALPLNQFSASQTANNLQSQISQGSPGFQTNQASSEVVRPTLGSGSQFNSFQSQTSSNVRPTQYPINANGAATQGQFKPQYPNSGQSSIPAEPTQASFGFSQATKQPDTELTTPLEPNESSPNKVNEVQPTDSSASSFASVGSKPNFPKPQFGSQAFGAKPSSIRPGQAEIGFAQNGNQSPFTSQSSAFAGSPSDQPLGSSPSVGSNQPQSTFNAQSFSGSQSADKQPQFGQNTFSQNRPGDAQFASSTQKPTFGQIGQSQGVDESYYYNQPSKPFNTPAFGSKIPSAPSNQFNGAQFSGNRPQNFPLNSGSSTPQISQNLGPSFASVAPTSPTQNEPTQVVSTSSTYNGITQASISPFGAAPTPATQFGSFESKPSQFNKPAQPMPATQFGSQQTQFGVKPSAQQPLSEHSQSSQFGFQQNQFGSKPQQPSSVPTQLNQFGYKPTQHFGSQFNQQTAQSKPDSQFNTQQQQFGSPQSQFGATPLSQQPLVDNKQPNQPSSSTQFGSQQSQFSSQQGQFGIKPISQQPLAGPNQPAQPATSTQFGSQQIQFGVKPLVDNNTPAQPSPASQIGFQQNQFGSQQTQHGVTPLSQQPLVDHNAPSKPTISTQFGSQQNQFGSQQTQFGVKPQQNEPSKPSSSFQFGSQQTQFGIKPIPQQPLSQFNQQSSQFGSQSSQFDAKPQKPIGQFGQTSFSQASVESKPSTQDTPNVPSQQYSGELYEYNKPDPVPTATSESSAGNNVASAQASVTTGQTDSSAAQTQEVSQPTFGPQAALNSQSSQSSQFGAQPSQPFGIGQTSQVQSTAGIKPQFPAFGKPCCQGGKPTQSSFGGPSKPTTTGFQAYKPNQASEGFGKGEVFGGPRDPPRFDDKTGYHY